MIVLIFFACERRTVKYSGLNDLVVGVHQVILYENGEFYLELGAGGEEGKYELKNDTVILSYYDKPENWPDKLLMTDDYFSTIYNNTSRVIKIKRWDEKTINKLTDSTIPDDKILVTEKKPSTSIDTDKYAFIKFSDFEIGFYDVEFWAPEDNPSAPDEDTILIDLDLASTVEGKPIFIKNTILDDIRIDQQFETSLTMTNEGPHLDLLDWKHMTSDWIEIQKIDSTQYLSKVFKDIKELGFPEFTEEELYQYLIKIGRSDWAILIKEPLYSDGQKHYDIGISTIKFRIQGINKDGDQIRKVIIFKIPMGC